MSLAPIKETLSAWHACIEKLACKGAKFGAAYVVASAEHLDK